MLLLFLLLLLYLLCVRNRHATTFLACLVVSTAQDFPHVNTIAICSNMLDWSATCCEVYQCLAQLFLWTDNVTACALCLYLQVCAGCILVQVCVCLYVRVVCMYMCLVCICVHAVRDVGDCVVWACVRCVCVKCILCVILFCTVSIVCWACILQLCKDVSKFVK